MNQKRPKLASLTIRLEDRLLVALEKVAAEQCRTTSNLAYSILVGWIRKQEQAGIDIAPPPARPSPPPIVHVAPQPGARRVLLIRECAEELGIADKTLRNLIDAGEGPPVTQLSHQRVGIRRDHFDEWLEKRRR